MNQATLMKLLEAVASGTTTPEEAYGRMRAMPFEDIGFAKIDHHRALRQGMPEVIFGEGKTPEQLAAIVDRIRAHGSNVLATRCSAQSVEAVRQKHPDAVHHELARAVTICVDPPPRLGGYVVVVCAGTSDLPVAEEAVVTCESMGNTVERVYDVGVAGIHRLFNQRGLLEGANCVVVCAGMEGALPSVVAGLLDVPVIATPTSAGYGASFGGLAALLGMLNSCSVGISVVNIDNGFGAGALAAMINRIANRK